MKIDICLAADKNYLKFMATTMLSILGSKASDETICFHILCDDLRKSDKDYLNIHLAKFNPIINFVDVDIKEFKDFPAGGPHISNTTYFRYKIARLLPDVSKIIYLDCDIIVLKPLSKLFTFDMKGNEIAGVEDVGVTVMRLMSDGKLKNWWSHYNAGVLLMDLNRFRQDDLFGKFMAYTQTHTVTMGDQEVINAVCASYMAELDYEFNVQDSFYSWGREVRGLPNRERIIAASLDPCILHYAGFRKPWNDFSVPQTDKWIEAYLGLTIDEPSDILRRKILHFQKLQKIFPSVALKRFVLRLIRLTRRPRWEIGRLINKSKRHEYETKLRIFFRHR